MRALFCALASLAFVVPVLPATKARPATLAILFRFHGPSSQIAFREMERELELLLEGSFQPEWRNRDTIAASDTYQNLVVVDFRGYCGMQPAGFAPDMSPALGWTHVTDGVILPFSEIQCDRVRATLQSAPWGRSQYSDLTLGRALARVLAHELYHILARTTAHTRAGIAKPSLSATELASDRLTFTRADIDRMKSTQQAPSVLLAGTGLEFVP
jgi:hypothetical protein